MYLRSKSGPHAGEVRNFPAHIGKILLADGRAEPEHVVATEPAPPQVSVQHVPLASESLPKIDASAKVARKPAARRLKGVR